MDLSLFFSSLSAEVCDARYGHRSFFSTLKVNSEQLPDYSEAQIALIGLADDRGNPANKGTVQGPDVIRQKLYALKKGIGDYHIVDFGNLKPGADIEETYLRLSEVCHTLLELNILPIILGNTHDQDYGQYRAYQDMEKLISFLNVDAFLDLDDTSMATEARKHIQTILLHEPNYLFGYTHLAHQSYLIDPDSIAVLEKLYFETYRIGKLRSSLTDMEPAIRNADLLSFDITAIRSADAPGNANAQPFGLSGEEACQLCWYAGLNEKLSSFGVYEYNPTYDDVARKTASVIATMIWYFIEGFYHRKQETNFKGNDFLNYLVTLPGTPDTISFYKSKFTDKWWMELQRPAPDRFGQRTIIPCSYNDYKEATRGQLPDRYIHALNKLK